jgi:hypothetical protein
MFRKNEIICHDQDFDYAVFLKLPLTVWQYGEILDYGGVVEDVDHEAIKINGAYFLRSTCQFKVR